MCSKHLILENFNSLFTKWLIQWLIFTTAHLQKVFLVVLMALWNDLKTFLGPYLPLCAWATHFTVLSIVLHWLIGRVPLPSGTVPFTNGLTDAQIHQLCHWTARMDTQGIKASKITGHSFGLSSVACLIVTDCMERRKSKEEPLWLSVCSTEESGKKVRWTSAPGFHLDSFSRCRPQGWKTCHKLNYHAERFEGSFPSFSL